MKSVPMTLIFSVFTSHSECVLLSMPVFKRESRVKSTLVCRCSPDVTCESLITWPKQSSQKGNITSPLWSILTDTLHSGGGVTQNKVSKVDRKGGLSFHLGHQSDEAASPCITRQISPKHDHELVSTRIVYSISWMTQ